MHIDNAITEPRTVDMRVIYAMLAFFLAQAPLNDVLKFTDARNNHVNATRWAVHMIRFYIALGKSADRKLADDHEVLAGKANNRIAAGDPEYITDSLKYYLHPEATLRNTEAYMTRIRSCIYRANNIVLDDDIVEGAEGEGELGGAAFWAQDAEIDLDVLDAVLERVRNGKNTVHTHTSPDGKVIGLEHAAYNIRNRAQEMASRQTRSSSSSSASSSSSSSSSLRIGLTVGVSSGSAVQHAPASARASRGSSVPASARASRCTTLTMNGTWVYACLYCYLILLDVFNNINIQIRHGKTSAKP